MSSWAIVSGVIARKKLIFLRKNPAISLKTLIRARVRFWEPEMLNAAPQGLQKQRDFEMKVNVTHPRKGRLKRQKPNKPDPSGHRWLTERTLHPRSEN